MDFTSIVQSGIDRNEFFSVHGSPLIVNPLFDRLFFNWNLTAPEKLSDNLSEFSVCSITLKEPVCFSLAHFDQDRLNMIGPGSKMIQSIIQDFNSQKKVSAGRVVFGRQLLDTSLFLGELVIGKDNTCCFEFTGCYNTLKKAVQLGSFQTPLDDESRWEQGMFPEKE